ncbi:MAG: tRNA 4-thiouridine(8) synthase ThiI [Candidatus Moranbacteria bacterium]|nr:tRNA 4-thiouridine(8) synthase ThiI [Candidatus Moranbacteria bacterium]
MKINQSRKKALLLFSGGLDSILAAKILARQGIEATALTFVSYFFDAEQAKKSAEENKIKILTKDFSKKHFEIVRQPCFGHGAGMNPCVDCHLLMLKKAKKIAAREKFDIIATGEVLGQRPMSQNIEALKLIEREAGLVREILRPLSAKSLPETEMEKTGVVDRGKLLGISGRGRKEQIELAKKFGVKNYPSPAGGCILTDKEYSKKLRELIEKAKTIEERDLKLLRLGRHFWKGSEKIILGRNHVENIALKKLAERGDTLLELKNIPGPLALVRGKNRKAIELAKEKILKYAKKSENKNPEFSISS